MTYKNGFPRPAGMIVIMVVISLACMINCAFASEPEKSSSQPVATSAQHPDSTLGTAAANTPDGVPANAPNSALAVKKSTLEYVPVVERGENEKVVNWMYKFNKSRNAHKNLIDAIESEMQPVELHNEWTIYQKKSSSVSLSTLAEKK